jgi:hypothetical protein
MDPPTYAASINDQGEITGQWGPLFASHDFLREANGTFTSFDVPRALSTDGTSINASGEITRTWSNASSLYHGFVREKNGTITTFDVPNSTLTTPASINAGGEVAGEYYDQNNVLHGLRRLDWQIWQQRISDSQWQFQRDERRKCQLCAVFHLHLGWSHV